jgi:hypothetical protein
MKIFFLVLVGLLFLPGASHAENVIGLDTVFDFAVLPVLTTNPSNPEYAQVFNFFFSIQVYFGLFCLWMRLLFRLFRM